MTRLMISLFALSCIAAPALAEDGPEGLFVTIDDKTEAPRGIVELSRTADGELVGTIRGALVDEPDSSPNCDDCEGELQGHPIIGLPFLYGLEPKDEEGREWKSGRIIDPESGETYKAKAEFEEGFDAIKVRGYIGTPILGRNQYWRRATPADIDAANAIATARDLPRIETPTDP